MPANRTTFLALCILAQAQEDARNGAVPASLGLRLALAYLHDTADRRCEGFSADRYVDFWRAATQQAECGGSAAAFGRSQILTASINGIARAAGMEFDVTLLERVERHVTINRTVSNGPG